MLVVTTILRPCQRASLVYDVTGRIDNATRAGADFNPLKRSEKKANALNNKRFCDVRKCTRNDVIAVVAFFAVIISGVPGQTFSKLPKRLRPTAFKQQKIRYE